MSTSNNDALALLCSTIMKSDKVTAYKLLSDDIPLNTNSTLCSDTPLHLAIQYFYGTDFITSLLDKGANIHARNYNGESPLQVAVKFNKEDVVQLLINKGVSIGAELSSLITLAESSLNDKLIKLLVKHEVEANGPKNFINAVNEIAESRNIDLVQVLLRICKTLKINDKYISLKPILNIGLKSNEIIHLLIQYGFKVSPANKRNFNFVYAAVKNNYSDIVRDILDANIDINLTHEVTGLTLVHAACIKKNIKMIKLLIEYNVNLNTKNSKPKSLIQENGPRFGGFNFMPLNERPVAAINVENRRPLNERPIAALNVDDLIDVEPLDNEPNIDAPFNQRGVNDRQGVIHERLRQINAHVINQRPLQRPVVPELINPRQLNRGLILLRRVRRGANNEIIGQPINERPINRAPANERQNGPLAILEMRANERPMNERQRPLAMYPFDSISNPREIFVAETPLFFAVRSLDAGITKLLLLNGADVEPNILITAIHTSSNEMIDLLLEHGADINALDDLGTSSLHTAAETGNIKIVEFLLERNADINITNKDKMTPLHLASIKKQDQVVKKLLQNNANINAIDKNGNNALHLVHHQKTVNVLLKYNANVNAINEKGETPLHTNIFHCGPDKNFNGVVIKTLLTHKSNINAVDRYGNTPLAVACKNQRGLFVKIFLKNNADVNCRDSSGKSPLFHAVINGYSKITEILLTHGADINITCNDNKTALDYAVLSVLTCTIGNEVIPQQGARIDINDFIVSRNRFTQTYKMLKEHAIKLQCAKLKVTMERLPFDTKNAGPRNRQRQNQINRIVVSKEMEDRCHQEIEKLKSETVGYINFYNLLTNDIHDIAKFAKNERVIQALQSSDLKDKFPLYVDIIKNRFAQAVKRNEVLEIAQKYSSTVFHPLPLICVDHIFRSLTVDDLKVFLSAIKK